jgi:carboxyl-terminal processing protease
VRPGTPAQAAGIAKGDVIVSIDGKDVALESLADVRAVFFGTPGTVVALGLTTKDGMPKTVKLTLEDFV